MKAAVLVLISYFLGSIPFGLILGKVFRGIDIRDFGSGNIGTTNVFRTLGPGLGTVVFVTDTAKGAGAVFLAKALMQGDSQAAWVIVAGCLAIIGHMASIFLKFRGGKGVATSLGMIVGMNPLIAAICFVLWVTLVAVTRFVSVASIIASFSVTTMMYFSPVLFDAEVPRGYTITAFVAALLILLKHRSNIKRLIQGTEPKFGQKVNVEGE